MGANLENLSKEACGTYFRVFFGLLKQFFMS